MENIQLIVFDMAGTTIRDNKEVESCFAKAAAETGLVASAERILDVQGLSKRFVFEMLWKEQMAEAHADLEGKVEHSYQVFKSILENHYRKAEVVPTAGCLELFSFLKKQQIQIALTTGFYRQVANIILGRVGWDKGLDTDYKGNASSIINLSIASDEVPEGRPSPLMIEKAMKVLGITNPKNVINIGDTPSDLESGRRAGCALSLGLTNGTHTKAQLESYPNDGLLSSLYELKQLLQNESIAY